MEKLIDEARLGDKQMFHELFESHRLALESFVYRLSADREETRDIIQDVYIKAMENIKNFLGNTDPEIKSWLFSIASNHAKNVLLKKKRWHVMAQDQCRDSLISSSQNQEALITTINSSPHRQYEIAEHIDFCFTCIAKTLTFNQQIALILKNVYGFKVREIAEITGHTIPRVKHALHDARKILSRIYRHRCSLVNKKGVCYQCDELNEIFRGKQQSSKFKKKLKPSSSKSVSATKNLKRRTALIKIIHPLRAKGTDLHHHLMEHLKKVNNYD